MKEQSRKGAVREILMSKRFAIVSISLILVFSPLILFGTPLGGKQSESSVAMSILGSNMKFGEYFPANNHTITLGEELSWYVTVHNGLANAEYLSVRVKLLNSTQTIPNDSLNQPSTEQAIFEVQQLVAKNSTWIIPLNWTISQFNSTNAADNSNFTSIQSVVLNGEDISDINIESSNGQGFKMIFELWRYDSDAKNFVFAMPSESTVSSDNDSNKRSVWTQIWFDVN